MVAEVGGGPVASGNSDPGTGRVTLGVRPGAYVITAEVAVRETEIGLATSYPARREFVVTGEETAPVVVEVRLPSVEPYLEKPGQYRIRR